MGRNVAEDLLKKNKKVRKVIIQEGFDDKNIISLIEKNNLVVETKSKRDIVIQSQYYSWQKLSNRM